MKKFTVLDGGLSTELTNMDFTLDNDPLWSSRLLKTSPESIRKAHENYVKAGSEIITTSSYQATIEGFVNHLNVSVEEAKSLMAFSVTLAKEAAEGKSVKIAASVGPYGASQADGSEYSGNYIDSLSVEELMDFHRPKMEVLLNAGCDMLALETIPALKEGLALVRLLKEFPNSHAWLSFSCKDDRNTSHGENFESVIQMCLEELGTSNQLLAIGANCCSPSFMASLLRDASRAKLGKNADINLVAYPNNGAIWPSKENFDSEMKERRLESYVSEWIDSGITWFGGCCQTDSKDISELVKTVNSLKSIDS